MSSPPPQKPIEPLVKNATYDPGWNDPPTMNYASSSSATKKPNLLNKRIGFSMQSSGGPPTVAPSLPNQSLPLQTPPPVGCPKLPPKVASLPPTVYASDRPLTIPGEDDVVDWRKLHDETLERLHSELKQLKGKLGDKDTAELERRLHLMSTAWLDQRLDARLQNRLRDISLALQSTDRLPEAAELHRSLAVDYGTLTAPWATALRHLILAKQKQLPQETVGDEQSNPIPIMDSLSIAQPQLPSADTCRKSGVQHV